MAVLLVQCTAQGSYCLNICNYSSPKPASASAEETDHSALIITYCLVSE